MTEEKVGEPFRHRKPTAVRRYVLPKLGAMNFVLENVLDGGVNDSLNLDSHGKTLAFFINPGSSRAEGTRQVARRPCRRKRRRSWGARLGLLTVVVPAISAGRCRRWWR